MKTLNEFVQLFAKQFEETEESLFAPDTEYRSLDEWSSLISLSVAAMVDEEFEVALRGTDIRTANTIEDLFRIIISKL